MVYRLRHTHPRVPLASRLDLAKRLDETRIQFKPGENPEETVRSVCENAILEQFRAVVVRPRYVALAASILEDTPIHVATVIGFPDRKHPLEEQRTHSTFGDMPWEEKVDQMRQAKQDGADEFDVLMNIAYYKYATATTTESPEKYEVAQLVENMPDVPIKLIIETDLLDDDEIVQATHMCIDAGIDMVKTSTGLLEGGQGATTRHVELIYRTIQESPVHKKPGIKASGGIRTAEHAIALLEAGADILGTSTGTQLLDDFEHYALKP